MKRIKLRNTKHVGKICNVCKVWKTISNFTKRKDRGKYSYLSKCKQCKTKIVTEYSRTFKGWLTKTYATQRKSSKERSHPQPSYSKEDLRIFVLSQSNCRFLFREWRKNSFEANFRPSIDRIESSKPYALDNIQLVTWKENQVNQYKVNENKPRVKIVQLSLEGTLINIWDKISDIEKYKVGSRSSVRLCCQNKRISSNGYKWMYLKDYLKNTIQDIDNLERDLQTTPIKPSQIQYNEDTCLVTIS